MPETRFLLNSGVLKGNHKPLKANTMKTKTCILMAFLLLIFSCSVSEESETEVIEMQSLQIKSPIAEILSTERGKASMSALFRPQGTAKGNGNGVVFIKNGADYAACSFGEDSFVCFYEIDENGFYRSPIDVQFLPNGEAQFKSRSKDFAVEVYNEVFDLIYSNLCYQERVGNLHINVKAPFELITDDPFVDFDYYRPVFDEISSANNLQLTAIVNDAARNLDIDNLTWDCADPTSEKKLKVTSLFSSGGNMNVNIKLH